MGADVEILRYDVERISTEDGALLDAIQMRIRKELILKQKELNRLIYILGNGQKIE